MLSSIHSFPLRLASLLSCAAVFFLASNPALGNVAEIIPKPGLIEKREGEFVINAETVLVADNSLHSVAEQTAALLAPATGFRLQVKSEAPAGAAVIELKRDGDLTRLGNEGYVLDVTPTRIRISGSEPAGIYYGVQTLRQLLPVEIFQQQPVTGKTWSVPAMRIQDQPRFGWRGLMLDVSRHFVPVESVKKFIDVMAVHKLNVLHWHLTDDQGWRIEIKKYPRLTEVASKRAQTVIGRNTDQYDGKPHEGFYTQEQVKDIVAYAAARHITVVPEIEMPGHSQAALAAYPELSCTGGPLKVSENWLGSKDPYCAGNDQVFTFLQDVLDEVLPLFPSKLIHIGGDECPKHRWKVCPKCQARMQAEGLKDEDELQSYFIRRMNGYLIGKGRRLLGWDEITEGGLAPESTVMAWHGDKPAILAAQQGHDVIMAPYGWTYFDFYQSRDTSKEPLAAEWEKGQHTSLAKVYEFDPIPKGLTPEEAKHILGGQGQLWAEYMPTYQQVEYMSYPRAAALAEVLWTRGGKSFSDFRNRLTIHAKRLDALNVNYRKPEPLPGGDARAQ